MPKGRAPIVRVLEYFEQAPLEAVLDAQRLVREIIRRRQAELKPSGEVMKQVAAIREKAQLKKSGGITITAAPEPEPGTTGGPSAERPV